MSMKQGLAVTTLHGQICTSGHEGVLGFHAEEELPEGTAIRYLVRFGLDGKWKKYVDGSWSDAETQELAPASVMKEGMDSKVLNSAKYEMAPDALDNIVNVAIALRSESGNVPAVTDIGITVKQADIGKHFVDGSVKWLIEDANDMDRVGDITLHSVLLPGHILADGSEVAAEDFPRLVSWVFEHDMLGDDAAHYAYNSETKKLRLPNAMGRVLQGESRVASKEAGLPNITGEWGITWNSPVNGFNSLWASGAFYKYSDPSKPGRITSEDRNGTWSGMPYFDASRSNPIYGNADTVQPRAITMLPQIKY